MTKPLKTTIGFEIHVELETASKMFCGCSANHFAKSPNTQTCPVCLALPGALPVPNKKAIEWTIMVGLALHCKIASKSKFDRKHYFYPDLPKGYQISQYDMPLCTDGYIDTSEGRIGIERVHLEEDTGKLQHAALEGKPVSLVDFNRSGVPLVEIVTKPDIHSSNQALEYAKKLREIIRSLKVSDCDMEKGSMRLEANISLGLDLGYKVEVKNVNSFRFIGKAIDFELKRQRELLEAGETPLQETRGWHEKTNATRSQRSKEGAADYRYFPEPDIPPMIIDDAWLEKIKSQMSVLPEEKMNIWVQKFGLRADYAKTIVASEKLTQKYEEVASKKEISAEQANKILGMLINKQMPIESSLEDLIGKITSVDADKITDETALSALVEQAVSALPKPAEDYKNGVDKAISALIGKVMSLSSGRADGGMVKSLLHKRLRK